MTHRELVAEVASRSGQPEESVASVLRALADISRDGHLPQLLLALRGPAEARLAAPAPGPTDPALVDELIDCARRHPQGLEFLRSGYLGSVAAEFHAHAFTVEAARERLK